MSEHEIMNAIILQARVREKEKRLVVDFFVKDPTVKASALVAPAGKVAARIITLDPTEAAYAMAALGVKEVAMIRSIPCRLVLDAEGEVIEIGHFIDDDWAVLDV